MNRSLAILFAALLIAGCDNNKPAETKTEDPATKNATTTGATQTAAANTAAAPPTIADTDLSTPADFEETAEKAISKANYKAELTTLEADIAKE